MFSEMILLLSGFDLDSSKSNGTRWQVIIALVVYNVRSLFQNYIISPVKLHPWIDFVVP